MKLEDKSKLYKKLLTEYEKKGNEDILFELFDECVNIAREFNVREIKFVLFVLKYMWEEGESNISAINLITEICHKLVGNQLRAVFMISVLETALDEMVDNGADPIKKA